MFRLTIVLLCITAAFALPPNKGKAPFSSINGRIINGQVAAKGQFPWQVAIRTTSILGSWFCGGSLISNQWVLTAAHCVELAISFTVDLGTNNLNLDAGAITVTANRYVEHEHYDDETLDNDVALIQLISPVTFNENIQSIPLATDPLATGTSVTVSGWGRTSDAATSVSSVLYFATVATISKAQCQSNYGLLGDGVVCTSQTGSVVQGVCGGDSGGPLITGSGNNAVLVGVVSFGSIRGCEVNAPSGYSSTAYYRDWIRQHSGV